MSPSRGNQNPRAAVPLASSAQAEPEAPRLDAHLALAACLLLSAAYLALFWRLDGFPFQDLPNHLARAAVQLDIFLHGGERFGRLFAFSPQFSPYFGGDALLAGLSAAFGPSTAGRIWVMGVAASLPASVVVYLRVTGYAWPKIAIGALLSLYLTTDVFFLAGFHHYRLAVALVFFALAGWERWLRHGSPVALVAWVLLLAAGYLAHLSALVFDAIGATITALIALRRRETSWRRAALGLAPLVALLAWQTFTARGLPAGIPNWRLATKAGRVVRPFLRRHWLVDGALFATFVGTCGLLMRRGRPRRARADRQFITPALLAAAMLVAFVAMPYARGAAAAVDVRAVPLAAIFGMIASLAAAELGERTRLATAVAVALATGNLVVVSADLIPQNAVMRDYRKVASLVPPGARVLPVDSGPSPTFHHAGTFATLDVGAYTPYLFAHDIHPYFRDVARTKSLVRENWYHEGRKVSDVERATILASFDYLLVYEPFDAARLGVRTEPAGRAGSVELLRIVR